MIRSEAARRFVRMLTIGVVYKPKRELKYSKIS